jgi:predicted 2-oxoglutarate/Fe(II)-dependent dioxygenase YbiX
VWEQQGHSETGVESSVGGGRAEQRNAQLKRRRDHVVGDPQRSRELATTIGRRVLPELSKAFAYRASRFEGFKIACYQASDRGFFSAHRDNLSPATAHRRFALTLNLNDGYRGGQLRFPEYGPERYRPAAGAALVFSCSHLHEVLEVTAGRRFVLLSFLFGEEAPRPA